MDDDLIEPSPVLSLTAQFDDLCRIQSSVASSNDKVFGEVKKVLKSCEQLRSKYLSAKKQLENANQKIQALEIQNSKLEKKLSRTHEKYLEKSKAYRNTIKELSQLRIKIQELNNHAKNGHSTPKDEDEIVNEELLNRLNNLRMENSVLYDQEVTTKSPVYSGIPDFNKQHSDGSDSSPFSHGSEISNPSSKGSTILSEDYLIEDNSTEEKNNAKSDDETSSSLKTVIESNANSPQTALEHSTPTKKNISSQNKEEISIYETPKYLSYGHHKWQRKVAYNRKVYCFQCQKRVDLFGKHVTCSDCDLSLHVDCVTNFESPSGCFKKNARAIHERLASDRTLMDFIVPLDGKPLIPDLLLQCCSEIEKRGLRLENIYKIRRQDSVVQKLMLDLLYQPKNKPSMKMNELDIHSLCNVVLYFLGYLIDLNDPLVPHFFWNDLVCMATRDIFISDQDSKSIEEIITQLPSANRDTLAFLMIHLRKVFKNEHINHVSMEQLAQIFAPKVIHYYTPEVDSYVLSGQLKKHDWSLVIKIMKYMLNIPSDFWVGILSKHTMELSSQIGYKVEEHDEKFQTPKSYRSINSSIYETPIGTANTTTPTKKCRMSHTRIYKRVHFMKLMVD